MCTKKYHRSEVPLSLKLHRYPHVGRGIRPRQFRRRRGATATRVAVHPPSATAAGYLWYVEMLGKALATQKSWHFHHFPIRKYMKIPCPPTKLDLENRYSLECNFPTLKLAGSMLVGGMMVWSKRWPWISGFATGLVWLTRESENVELLGHVVKNDPVYSGGPVQGEGTVSGSHWKDMGQTNMICFISTSKTICVGVIWVIWAYAYTPEYTHICVRVRFFFCVAKLSE